MLASGAGLGHITILITADPFTESIPIFIRRRIIVFDTIGVPGN